MARLKPWHQVATPREDLRAGQPLDASEFAIHLDQVIDGRAPRDYRNPERFFARTYLTATFSKLAAEVMRRLSGDIVGTSPGVNLTTQFGGGKTHFLALLYHLFREGRGARNWTGVEDILSEAGLTTVPRARVAAFIGNRFDFVTGVGAGGEPKRRTPWGDIAWQLGGPDSFALVQEHDEQGVVPGGELVQKLFTTEPTLILMDEVLSFIRRARDAGEPYARLGKQFYSYLDVLTREVAGARDIVLVVSLPTSEYEMTQDDQAEFQRLDKLLGRLSKAVLLSEQMEIAEIVRRRLFEDPGEERYIRSIGREYGAWAATHREQLPGWFPFDQSARAFEATYPFHPSVLSVFERKWQSLPAFQRTRGILRLLALWVSRDYLDAFRSARKDPLIALGSAPLEDSVFRAAVFEQLGEERLEAAVLSDIAGAEAHAVRMDHDAPETISNTRLHQKVATAVFFESSGGQVRNEATLPEIRLAVAEPGIEIGNVETVLDDLVRRCYYLDVRGTAYWISHRPTVNKILADRRAILSREDVAERVRQTIRSVFDRGPALSRRYWPESSDALPDTPSLTLAILAPEHSWGEQERDATRRLVRSIIQESASRSRTFKSGLLFALAETAEALTDEARNLLAIEMLEDPAERERLRLETTQMAELDEKKARIKRELNEDVWRAYRHLLLLGEDGTLQELDLGLVHSSAAESLVGLIMARLRQEGLLEDTISPDFLVRNWPPALEEWSTKGMCDTFYASPKFPRLLDPDALRQTVADGVRTGKFGYVGKSAAGDYQTTPIIDDTTFGPGNVEFSDQVVLLPRDVALTMSSTEAPTGEVTEAALGYVPEVDTGAQTAGPGVVPTAPGPVGAVGSLKWTGLVPAQKWMNFYTRVLTRFGMDPSLGITVSFDVAPETGITQQQVEETKMALRDLGLSDAVEASDTESAS